MKPLFLVLIGVFVLTPFSAFAPDEPRLPEVLVTGFRPFRGGTRNASGDIVSRHLAEAVRNACPRSPMRFDFSAPLPVTLEAVHTRASERDYAMVLSIGIGANANTIVIETEARNCLRLKAEETCIVPRGRASNRIRALPNSVTAPLNIANRNITLQWGDENSCGDFICNATLYRGISAGMDQHFIHIPDVPESEYSVYAQALATVLCRMVEGRHASSAATTLPRHVPPTEKRPTHR